MLPFMEQKNTDLFLYSYRNFSFPAHFHDGLEIIYALGGTVTLNVEGENYPVAQGKLGVVLPGQIHSYDAPPQTANEGRIILLGQRLLGEYYPDLSGRSLEEPVFTLEELHPHCKSAVETLVMSGGEDVRLQKAYASLFLCRFLPSARLTDTGHGGDPLLYSLVRYMGDHFRENIGLGDVAAALYVSKYHLSRLFSQSLKMNFNSYLNSLRVNAAIGLMDSADLAITKIAYEVGFGNVRTFNRAFLKETGVTPRIFRKRNIR